MAMARNKIGVGLLALGCGSTLAIGGVTVAQATGAASSVRICEAKTTHVLHLGTCKRGEHEITVSKQGPRGLRGPKGPNGIAGPGSVVWQAEVKSDGTTLYAHDGVTVTNPNTNSFTVAWSGFPGTALPYCVALGSTPLSPTKVVNNATSGSITLSTTAAVFWCQIVQE